MSCEFSESPFSSPNPTLANLVRIEFFDENGVSYWVEYRNRSDFNFPTASDTQPTVPFPKAA